MSFRSLTSVPGSSPARTSISIVQASISSESASFTTNSNVTSLDPHLLNYVLPASASSAHASIASSTLFSTSTNSGINTLTVGIQIAIPTTSLSPIDPAAIAGGIAIGEGLNLLYSKALSISDESELIASKTGLIDSIETLKSDLEKLSTDLGGIGNPACSSSKSRFRRRKRSLVSDLLNTITSTICSLAEVQTDIDTVPPDLGEIEADWVEIESLADDLTTEEAEEEEEEEKESQSAEERASETARSQSQASTSTLNISASSVPSTNLSDVPLTSSGRPSLASASTVPSTNLSSVPSTSVSSVSSLSAVPNSCYTGLIQAYPVDIEEPDAAEDAIFAVAGAALFAIMGGISGSNTSMSKNGTSISSSTSATGLMTTSKSNATSKTNTNILSQTTNIDSLKNLQTSGSVIQNGIANSSASASISAAAASESPPANISPEYQSSSTPTANIQATISTSTFTTIESLVSAATPSQAIVIYRRDLCVVTHYGSRSCSSWALEYDITPGQSVDTCEGQPTYEQKYPQYEGGVTSNYAIDVGPFTPHSIPGCSYIGTNQVVGNMKCDLFEAPCSVPTATVRTCDLATDTPIAYAEW